MTLGEIRSKYLEFFKARGHVVVPSASLVPQNDPTTLFTGSGMQPLLPYLLGSPHPQGKRLVNSQKSFRSMDIEEVGDNRHTTFFEMLGNWSFGDYFKEEQLPWFFEFLTKEIGLPAERLWVTCFEGDAAFNLPQDRESAEIWKRLGIPEERIKFYGAKKNWWSRAGEPANMPPGEPGGPDSEVFFDFGTPHDPRFGKECHPNCDCGRFMEIGNSVFMEYVKNADGTFSKLPQRNVDFGGGLERITAAANNDPDVFNVDSLRSIISHFEGVADSDDGYEDKTVSYRIIADHMRAACFLVADGVSPSNTDQGYFLRRLIRRSVLHADKIGIHHGYLAQLCEVIVGHYKDQYPGLEDRDYQVIYREEDKFRATLARGLKEFEKLVSKGEISGKDAFTLFTSYGFPLELIVEMAPAGISVGLIEFADEMKKHQDLSRAGAQQKFKGGLADTAEKTVKLHTAHHLLLRALQLVLGEDVKQRGSNITQERLRIDFSSPAKLTKEQLAEVEHLVNEKIDEDLPVIRSEMSKEDAEKLGAEHEFGQHYGDRVSVYSVGPKGATPLNPQFNKRFSIEFCGGPHVTHTGAIAEGGRRFKIQKEEAVAAGVRRIKAVLE